MADRKNRNGASGPAALPRKTRRRGDVKQSADDLSPDDLSSDAGKPVDQPASFGPTEITRQYELVELVKAYDPQADEDLLNRAYVFSMMAHGEQTRQSGAPYFTHPLSVAGILTELRADPATVATALLHDVVEDTDVTVEDIRRTFGDEIATLVDGVTKLSKIELKNIEQSVGEPRTKAADQAEQFRKLVVAMAQDVRVLLVKLADRLHNMRTLHFINSTEKRQRIAHETMEIYAPLAGRIGVQKFREELEDLSFKELTPEGFATIQRRLAELQQTSVAAVVELSHELRERLALAGVKAEVHSREKRPYSIWRKMASKNVKFEDLADIYAFRVVTTSVDDCYKALGVVHTRWRMIPSEFDDYISSPKPNNYRSIHTAVLGPPRDNSRQRIEIQIRTREMHETAERGVAAHWQYKDAQKSGRSSVEIVTPGQYDPYETPRKLVEMFAHGEDAEEALRYAKLELFQDQVFCFTPKGRVIALPSGATTLDFAYALHSDIGDDFISAKINGARKPSGTPLRNGDVVEVTHSRPAPIPADWEAIATTGRARAAIKRRIKKLEYDESVRLGRNIAENVFAGAKLDFTPRGIKAALVRLGEKTVDDVFAKVARQEITVRQLIEGVYPGAATETEGEIRAASRQAFKANVAIEGLPPSVAVRMAPCCTPIPGERIIGIRNEDHIIVHSIRCEVLERLEVESPDAHWLNLSWRQGEGVMPAFTQVVVTVRNEVGVLSDVAGVIARHGVSIANIKLRNRRQDFVEMHIDVEIKDQRQLENLLAGLRASSAVIEAERREV